MRGPKTSEEASFLLLLSFPALSFSIFSLLLTPPYFLSFLTPYTSAYPVLFLPFSALFHPCLPQTGTQIQLWVKRVQLSLQHFAIF